MLMDSFLQVLYRSPVQNNFCVMSRFVECSEWIIFNVLSRLGWMLPTVHWKHIRFWNRAYDLESRVELDV